MMLSWFDAWIVSPGLCTHYAEAFNFEEMEMVSDSAEAYEHLEIAGDDAINWLAEKYHPMLDAQTVKNKSLLVKNFVKAWYECFFDNDLAQPG